MASSSSKVTVSRVVKAPIDKVWDAIAELDFTFWSLVERSDLVGRSPGEIGSIRKVTFKDKTVQKYKVLEISELDHFITYELIESDPPVPVMSAIYTIHAQRVTSDNTTFVKWSSEFSSDGGLEATQDSKYKKQEALADLSNLIESI
ncbi:hypothetical protein H4219_004296 [Mycoemilia scoparia]|uniref:Bet v I/Major latex protein domain-containing protein n=1 Tax=Mycoemilia scoparia TaxID=417184 RepID=A0A9W8DRD3_9FUNG|nr:hypothetical protein H4219_004296 [Mycoemilia scoparia]